jgi:hypothetical protein
MASEYQIRELNERIEKHRKLLARPFWKEYLIWFSMQIVIFGLSEWMRALAEETAFNWVHMGRTAVISVFFALVVTLFIRWSYRNAIRRFKRNLEEELKQE